MWNKQYRDIKKHLLQEDPKESLNVDKNIQDIFPNKQFNAPNPAEQIMKILQVSMKGEAEKAGIKSPQDIIEIIKKLRD